jgi:hypothetical protein
MFLRQGAAKTRNQLEDPHPQRSPCIIEGPSCTHHIPVHVIHFFWSLSTHLVSDLRDALESLVTWYMSGRLEEDLAQ